MILQDEVTVIETSSTVDLPNNQTIPDNEIANSWTVPARVDFRSTDDDQSSGGFSWGPQNQHLVAVLEYELFRNQELSPRRHNIIWRGKKYPLDGRPLLRMRGDDTHHYSVALQGWG